LRKREEDGFICLPKGPRFHQGEPLKVTQGPLSGHTVLYDGMSAKERVRCLMNLLGRKVVIEFSAVSLTAA